MVSGPRRRPDDTGVTRHILPPPLPYIHYQPPQTLKTPTRLLFPRSYLRQTGRPEGGKRGSVRRTRDGPLWWDSGRGPCGGTRAGVPGHLWNRRKYSPWSRVLPGESSEETRRRVSQTNSNSYKLFLCPHVLRPPLLPRTQNFTWSSHIPTRFMFISLKILDQGTTDPSHTLPPLPVDRISRTHGSVRRHPPRVGSADTVGGDAGPVYLRARQKPGPETDR